MANDPTYPCDISKITAIAIHDYSTCVEDTANQQFLGPEGEFQAGFVALMDGYGGIDWYKFINETPYWMTETNCNHKPWGISNVDACLAVTGQNQKHYGNGGMYAYNQNTQFERMAWWSVSGTILASVGSNYLNPNNTAEVFPCGRAFINGFGSDTDCTSFPTGDPSDESDAE